MKHFGATICAVGLSGLLTPAAGVLRGRPDASLSQTGIIDGCGSAPKYDNTKTKNYADGRATKYNVETKKTEPVVFKAGDMIDFECAPGFSTDGSKDGAMVYQVECTENGYYKPKGVCVEASKCGAVPAIPNAIPTGQKVKGGVEMGCEVGHSLDGENVIAGGLGKNRFFVLECVEFSGAYKEFTGECKPYAFVASSETRRLYNEVAEALFTVSCKGSIKTAFGDKEIPAGLDNSCKGFEDSAAACAGLVTKIKADFESELKAREEHDKAAGKEWYDEKDADRPGIGEEAQTFCTELWALLKMPSL